MRDAWYFGISEQSKAAVHRRADAQSLFDAERWQGAMYLAGYALECLLKAKLMKQYGCRQLDDLGDEFVRRGLLEDSSSVYTHEFALLLKWSGRLNSLQQDRTINRAFAKANRWSPSWRYSSAASQRESAEEFLVAIDSVRQWVETNL